ncbi:MAG: branched-chain amino acid ABC transporter permease, partial [Candidatus Omnitrophica bacterium]|nr:branched-chain amino acid ABC transporter permease [Candidatus Omnitrophota bacterium]
MDASEVFFQQIINGVTIGMIYALIALGYTIVYGIAQLINFAHGEVFMVGAYLGLLFFTIFQNVIPGLQGSVYSLPLVIICVMVSTALLGALIERLAYKPLRHAPRLAPLITAIGVSFVLQNAVMLIFGPADKTFPPVLPLKKISMGSVTLTNIQILITLTSVILMAVLHLFITRTRTGKAMRALADDMKAASLMGINVDRTIMTAFIVGAALAGAGGVMFGLYYSTINFHDGYLAGLKAFT